MSFVPLKRLILGVVLAIGLFYLGWLGMSYARTYLPHSTVAAAQTTVVTTSTPTTTSVVQSSPSSPIVSSFFNTGSTVSIDGNTINVAVASTTVEIDQGLQNQPAMNSSEGELFLFSKSEIYRFWMPNMNFPLDMIWISGDKVVGYAQDAVPQPGVPLWNLKIYTSPSSVDKVLEVNAGTVTNDNIKVGDSVTVNGL